MSQFATVESASDALIDVRNRDGALLILTGAGMSVQSGVPVFRNADGSMSAAFTAYLNSFNEGKVSKTKTYNIHLPTLC